MHPMMITALAHEVERERQDERRRFHLRRQVPAEPSRGGRAARRRLVAGISLRPRIF